jgi:dipeptidyl aminopeptidase/acylaminoacyl peptidase
MKKWAFVLLLWPLAVLAEDTRPLSAEVLWELDRVGSPVISPVGGHVVAPVTQYDISDDSAETRLYLFSADGDTQRPLTAEGHSASSPVFSPNGEWLAFVSRRNDDEAGQIYLLPMNAPGDSSAGSFQAKTGKR